MITGEMIPKIEHCFGFPLHDWQKDYLLGESGISRVGGRANGKTFIYCVKLLLSDGEPIHRKDLRKWIDGTHGCFYTEWFTCYCLEINQTLVDAGFKTRLVK